MGTGSQGAESGLRSEVMKWARVRIPGAGD